MGQFSLEVTRTIWDDKHGEKITVGPDSDALNLVVITDHERDICIMLQPDQADLVADALRLAAQEARKADGA